LLPSNTIRAVIGPLEFEWLEACPPRAADAKESRVCGSRGPKVLSGGGLSHCGCWSGL